MWAYVYQLRGRTRAERPPASSTPGSPLTQIVGGDVKDLADGARRQAALGQEHGGRAACDQVREVLLGVGGDQDRPRRLQARLAVEPPHELEAALVGEVDVHQRDVRLELLGSSQRLRAGGGNPDHGDPLSFQETACGLHEAGAVVDDEAAQSHAARIAGAAPRHIPASWNMPGKPVLVSSRWPHFSPGGLQSRPPPRAALTIVMDKRMG